MEGISDKHVKEVETNCIKIQRMGRLNLVAELEEILMEERVFGVSSEEGKGHWYLERSSRELWGGMRVREVELQGTEEQKVFEHSVALCFEGTQTWSWPPWAPSPFRVCGFLHSVKDLDYIDIQPMIDCVHWHETDIK